MIVVDGSMGEGGGQVLRTALALSMVTGRPFRIENIRVGRSRPGLMRQHLTAVEASRVVCAGQVSGAELGATGLEFAPGAIRGGDYTFAIGTAGSTTLVLQTILPALVTAPERSTVMLSGGTHSTHAPSVHFLQRAFLPLLERMGPSVSLDLQRHGFSPAGGGKIRVDIDPVARLRPFELREAKPITARRAVATIAGLPAPIAMRELSVIGEKLGWPEECLRILELPKPMGPGNVVTVEVDRGDVTEVFTGFGERGVAAERVAANTAKDVQRYLASDVPIWRHLADQVMLPMAISGGGAFRTGPLSNHASTNARVIELFLPVSVERHDEREGACCIEIGPAAHSAHIPWVGGQA